MSDVNVQDDVRELTLAELDEIAGGLTLAKLEQIASGFLNSNLNTNIAAQNVGVGAINSGGLSFFTINIGIGELIL